MSLTSCIKRAGTALDAEDKAAILAAAQAYRQGGMSAGAAGVKAVDDQLAAVRAMIAQLGATARVDPAPAPAEPATVEPENLAALDAALAAGKRVHYDYAGTDGRTLWIEETPNGWVLKDRGDGESTTYTKGGVGVAGGWSKTTALRTAREVAEFRFTKWKPTAAVAPSPVAAPTMLEDAQRRYDVADEQEKAIIQPALDELKAEAVNKALTAVAIQVKNRQDKNGKWQPIDMLKFNEAVAAAKRAGVKVSSQAPGSSGTVVWAFEKPDGDAYSAYLEKSGKGTWMSQKPAATPAPAPAADPDAEKKAKALSDLNDALGDLAGIFGKDFKANMLPEQEQKLMPVLTRVMDAAFRAGYYSFKQAARFVLDTIRDRISPEVADSISLQHLQGSYIGMSGRHPDAEGILDVAKVTSLAEILGPLDAGVAADPAQVRADGFVAAAKALADLNARHPGVEKRFGSLDVEARRMVVGRVLGVLQDAQVRQAVVALVPVDVMNDLIGAEAAPESLLDYRAMLVDKLTADSPQPVVVGAFQQLLSALGAAKDPDLDVGGKALDRDAAGRAGGGVGTARVEGASARLGAEPGGALPGVAGVGKERGGADFARSHSADGREVTPKPQPASTQLPTPAAAPAQSPAAEQPAAGIEAQNEGTKDRNDDTQGNGADDAEPLDPQLPRGNPGLAEGLAPEAGGSVRPADPPGNGRAGGRRAAGRTGMGRGAKPVLPETPAEVRPIGRSPVAGDADAQNQLPGEAPGNYEITAQDAIGEGTEGQKLRANMEAIRTLRRIQRENRNATPEEQAVMAKFVGWGGLRKLIDPNTTGKQWLDARAELLGTNGQPPLLVEGDKGSEWIALQRSTTAAHFTAPEIVTSMWSVVRHFGFTGGRVLEPTPGIGNFIGLQPRDLAAASEWHGAELDIITGQMAKLIYPEAAISAGIGFENVPFAKGAFALAIGNPPFGSLTLSSDVAAYKGIPTMKIHNFIISKTGEHLRPGGVMAMVVTHRFLDTANPEAREHLAKSFKFLGAFRLPNDAFLKNAGTEVTTDVIFLQKLHVGEKAPDLDWLDTEGTLKVDGKDIRVNRYYEKNPANILGRSAMDGTMYAGRQGEGGSGEYTVHSDGRDLTQAIADMLTNQWADLKDVAKATNSDASASAVMIQQSDLPVGGVMVDADGTLRRREMDDDAGNAVVVEVTPTSLWRDGAEKWKRALDVLTTFRDKNLLTVVDGTEQFKEAIAVAYAANGGKKPKPTRAELAIYTIADALDRPGYEWRFDAQLEDIRAKVQRGMLGEDGVARLKGLVGLRNTTLQLIEAERRDQTADMKELRARLNAEYDAFVASYGLVNDPDNAGLLDGDVGVESGLESGYRAKNGKVKASAKKADIFTQRVNFPYREVTSAKDAADGLQVSLSERGRLDIPYIAKLTGQSKLAVINELSRGESPLIFLNPDTNEYVDADQYLSGNVKIKLQKAQAAGLRENVRALEAVQPAPKAKDKVRPSIRGAWMPESVFQEFLADLGARNPRVSIIASQGMILASSDGMKETEFGTQFKNSNKSVVEIFNAAASGKPITIWNTDSKGNRIKNELATKEVNLLVERMAKVFQGDPNNPNDKGWAFSDDARVQQIVDAFNEKMNTHVARQYDGNKYLRPVGASPSIELRTTQKNAAWRIVQAPTVLLDHVVGAGKTYTIITGAMQRRRLGLSRKPMIVVPNHLVTQWARDYYALYPGAKILAATPDDFAKNKRRRLFSRIATGDFDAVIIGHSSLAFIETPVADQTMVVNEQIKDLQDVLNELKRKKESGRTLTQIQEKLQKYEGKLKALQDVRRDEIGIDLEKMGVDYLAIDEMHEFKNLEYSTAGERVVGMNDPQGSKKAFDLYLKIRGLLARGGAVTGATGTPVSNSLVELYTMMKYLAHQDLVDRTQLNFDAWSGAYARTETKLEYTATQKLKPRRVLAGLNNLSALKQLYEQFADVISMADLKRIHAEDVRRKNAKDGTTLREGFPVPKVKSGGRVLESGPITEAQSTYMDYLVARMQAIEANKRNKEYAKIDNPLYVLTDARKMSLDIRIVDPTAPRDANGKVMRAAANVVSTYKKWDKDRGAQMIFCDLSTPAKNAVKEARSLIRESVTKLFGETQGKRLLARITALESFTDQWRLLESLANEAMENPGTDPEVAEKMEAYLGGLEDVDATMTTADVGFSVYDDMRAVLVEKGIPEAEIAFIHDYNTPEQKAKLFAEVNDGTIRVLMGSSAKMGAGTNAQRRLVAMHHMDAPWRPSDVEQREGRIIRQGNMLFDRDPDGFEVDIRAYSTAGTSDAVMWQVLERKSRAIEEFRNAGLDHTDEEGSDSNQYAEFMAQSTGNPVFRLKLEAERAVDVLDTDSRGALMARGQALRFMQTYAEDVAAAQKASDYADAFDVSTVEVRGQSGTAAEFEAVMQAAREKYNAAYGEYLERKAAAETELKAWEALTELERGDKPKMPATPSMPGMLSKSILDASGYARAVKAALGRASDPTGYEFKFGSLRMKVRQSLLDENQWTLQAWNGYSFESYTWGEGKTADSSSKLANAMTPEALRLMARQFGYAGQNRLDSLKSQYETKAKLASKLIDTSKLERAKEVMEWYRSQVSFAEQQADIRRGERPNRYIQGDKKRPLSQARVEAGEKIAVEFEGEVYQLTGFSDGNYMQAMGADGREVLLQMPLDRKTGKRNAERVIEKPKGVTFSGLAQKADATAASTNLAQTGSPAANDTDVVFASLGFKQQTETPAFKRWFGDSKVVDAQGKPLVVYHGTNQSFDTFDPERSREGDEFVFVTPSPKVASDFAMFRTVWGGANVMPVYVSAKKVLTVEGKSRPIREVENAARVDGMRYGETIRDFAARSGYDAIHFKDVTDDVGPNMPPVADIYALLKSAQIKSATGNSGAFDPANPSIVADLSRVGDQVARQGYERADVKRMQAARRLQGILADKAAGKLTPEEFDAAVAALADQMADVSATKQANRLMTERQRGADMLRVKLINARRTGELDPDAVGLGLWLLDKNPSIASDLSVSILTPKDGSPAGDYNPVTRVIRLFKDTGNADTIAHEILHHTERMMPPELQAPIRAEWAKRVEASLKAAQDQPAVLAALQEMMAAAAGNQEAYQRTVKNFRDGVLDYGQHYQLYNPSEFWAVNGARILTNRFLSQDSVWRKIQDWLRDMVQYIRGALGLRSDAPVLRALANVTDPANFGPERGGDFMSEDMLGQGDDVRQSLGFKESFSKAGASLRDVHLPANYRVGDFLNADGRISWWHKTVGTMHNLAARSPLFKRTYDAVQSFVNDVSFYATEAADQAPRILPKLDKWRDIWKSPLSPEQAKAIAAPIFEGTLTWARDISGKPVKVADLEAAAANLDVHQKAQELLRRDMVDPRVLRMWQGLPMDQYESIIETKYQKEALKPGVVWKDSELKSMFGLTEGEDGTISLYREARRAIDKSLNNLAIADMLRLGGDDVASMREKALATSDPMKVAVMLRDRLFELAAEQPDRANVLNDTGNRMIDKADQVGDLKTRGYAPLSRFGQYTLDVVDDAGERVYFGLFESAAERAKMARQMRENFPGASIESGTVSEEEYRLFAGVSPETLELFGEFLGLEADGGDAASKAFQTYIKLTKSTRSAMKRLIERKGIDGFSEDVGRVLAGFVYSNARQTSSSLHQGEIAESVAAFPKGPGQMKDAAVQLMEYVKNPQEEAQMIRGWLFAQYLGGSVASALVNMTQPATVTLPYLSQFGGAGKAAKRIAGAARLANKESTGDAALDKALKIAEETGVVSPQEVHQLQAQAMGRATLRTGDGTRTGDLYAKGMNKLAILGFAWGKLFGMAEQVNRRITFIAAYRTAVDEGMRDPAKFATQAVTETQFTYNKGNKPKWARGAIGSILFTFKQYSISYLELMNRMWNAGAEGSPERAAGRKAVLLAMAVLFLAGGADGLPFMEDAEDVLDAFMQRLGYNFSSKQARHEFLADVLGEEGARFVANGLSGLPGAPLDVSGRMGMGNLIPGTGLLPKKADHTRDATEIIGPMGDFVKRGFQAVGQLVDLEPVKALTTISPVAARNAAKAIDMANTGMYRDDRGRKVIDTDGYDALIKAISFQPNSVARVQESSRMVQNLIAQNKLRESEIADKWAIGIFEGDPDKQAEARADLARWNDNNPTAPIKIEMPQVLKRVRAMRQSKAERLEKTAPREIRAQVKAELAGAGQ